MKEKMYKQPTSHYAREREGRHHLAPVPKICWRYAGEAIIKGLLLYLSVYDKYLHPML
jgi:hypothetical protein